jgi:asparagine synthetase B (glutamine-hydrolysing)
MADTIIHRGPDAEAFGSIRRFHSRLAIVGCPSLPSQPITSTRF